MRFGAWMCSVQGLWVVPIYNQGRAQAIWGTAATKHSLFSLQISHHNKVPVNAVYVYMAGDSYY